MIKKKDTLCHNNSNNIDIQIQKGDYFRAIAKTKSTQHHKQKTIYEYQAKMNILLYYLLIKMK